MTKTRSVLVATAAVVLSANLAACTSSTGSKTETEPEIQQSQESSSESLDLGEELPGFIASISDITITEEQPLYNSPENPKKIGVLEPGKYFSIGNVGEWFRVTNQEQDEFIGWVDLED